MDAGGDLRRGLGWVNNRIAAIGCSNEPNRMADGGVVREL